MNKTRVAVIGTISRSEIVKILEILTVGCVVLALGYGAIKHGYVLEGSRNGVEISLKPA